MWSCGAYIDAFAERQATAEGPARALRRRTGAEHSGVDYNNFTQMNRICRSRQDLVQPPCPRLFSIETEPHFEADRFGGLSIDAQARAGSFEEITMLRKLSLAAVAAVALGAALAPTSASAHWHGGWGWHGGGWHHGWGWGAPRFYVGGPVSYGYGGCYVRRLVPTPWGPRCRLINRCY